MDFPILFAEAQNTLGGDRDRALQNRWSSMPFSKVQSGEWTVRNALTVDST